MIKAWVAPPWIVKTALETMVQKNMDKTGTVDPYVKQVKVAPETAVKEQSNGKRKGTNRFLELLETKEDGVSAENAHRIFAIVVKIVP